MGPALVLLQPKNLQKCSGNKLRVRVLAAPRFLLQPSRPNAPRPVAKSGSVARSGVAAVFTDPTI